MGLTVALCCREIKWTGGLPLEVISGSAAWDFMGGGDWNAHRGEGIVESPLVSNTKHRAWAL
jgi:hypothetical protein